MPIQLCAGGMRDLQVDTVRVRAEARFVSTEVLVVFIVLLSPFPYQCARHSIAMAVTLSNWITEVILPRGFSETSPTLTCGPTQATYRYILSESGAPC